MHTVAILLVLAGCLVEAIYNTCLVKMTRQNPLLKQKMSTLVCLTGFLATGMLFLTAWCTGGAELTPGWWEPVLITGCLLGGILFSEFRAFSLEDASLIAPISSTTPALVVLTSLIILGEYPSWTGWLGIQLIATGTYLLNIQAYLNKRRERGEKVRWIDWLAPFAMLMRSKGVRYAYLCVLFAIFALNYEAMAVRRANVAFASGCILGIASLINFFFAVYKEGAITRHEVAFLKQPLVLTISIGLFLMLFLSNAAFRYDIVPYVGTLKRLQIPITIIFAWFFLGERASFKERFAGGSLMALGAVLLALGNGHR